VELSLRLWRHLSIRLDGLPGKGHSQLARVVTVALLCSALVGCGQLTNWAAVRPAQSVTPAFHGLSCTIKYAGHGVDTLNYGIACRIGGPAGAKAFSLSGTSTDDPLAHYTWCRNQSLSASESAACAGNFVIIVPHQIHTVTVTAVFSPGDERFQTTVTVPSPSS
jgi:hypothetical protein